MAIAGNRHCGAGLIALGVFILAGLVYAGLGVRRIRSDQVGIVEKWWSPKARSRTRSSPSSGEAGDQPYGLRGGVHLRTPFMYEVHRCPLVTIPQGQIGYVFARDGAPLPPAQTLGRVGPAPYFQDVRRSSTSKRQKGPQRAILREGTYAFNFAQFVVMTEASYHHLPMGTSRRTRRCAAR